MSAKTWFITGTSRGFGREWALAALERGDSVVATARNASSMDTSNSLGPRIISCPLLARPPCAAR